MVEAARKVLDFERVYAGIIAIGVAAFLFRWLLKVLEDRLFPWQREAREQSEPSISSAHGTKK
jgi:ABC-type nitrate/sulfonate/bicarbonate transport system permease component